MRFTFVSVALLALAHSIVPGVHGAPAVASDHTNSLAVRQVGSFPTSLLDSIVTVLQSILGTADQVPAQLVQQLAQKLVQELENSASALSGAFPRALSSSSDPTSLASSTSSTTLSPTTTSHVLVVATDPIGTSTVSNVSSVSLSTPQASSTPQTRMRRQLPTSLPTSVLSAVPSIVGTQSALQPVQSVPASVLSAVLSKLGSVASKSAASKPTPSGPGVSTTQV